MARFLTEWIFHHNKDGRVVQGQVAGKDDLGSFEPFGKQHDITDGIHLYGKVLLVVMQKTKEAVVAPGFCGRPTD